MAPVLQSISAMMGTANQSAKIGLALLTAAIRKGDAFGENDGAAPAPKGLADALTAARARTATIDNPAP
jgi:hypothetical protein